MAAGPGCGPVDQTTRAIESGIQELDRNSAAWRDILERTRDKLIQQGQSTLATEVNNLLSSGVSDVAIESRCTMDHFFKDRARNVLEMILFWHKHGEKPSDLQPVFCNPTPAEIKLDLEPERRTTIEISGYNLRKDAVRVAIERTSNGEKRDVSNYLDHPSSYLLTVNVGRLWNEQKALLEDGTRFVFTLGAGADARTQSVAIVPYTVQPKTTYVATRLRISGTMDMWDDENWPASDEKKQVAIDDRVIVRPGATARYYRSECVGDEVTGYVNMQFDVDYQTGRIFARGLNEYFEQDNCSRKDHQADQAYDFMLFPRSENGDHGTTERTSLNDRQGGVTTNLLIEITDECLSNSPPDACGWARIRRQR